ncbi:SDR family NAD(P)-dependent oxidoreductase [Algoriphagus sp.]|uniref:SDR family NAD(P)-dependent oxidoreductase n=1 Tax=Algoriphagus sp. TaxID=1872435 RepID=UPI0039199CD4
MDFWVQKRVWIIGASSGIGEGLVHVLARNGAELIISARNETKLQELKDAYSESEIESLSLDVELRSTLAEKSEKAWNIYGGLDYVFLNAGMSVRDLVVESKLEVERKIMDINFWGPVAITKKLLEKRDANIPLHLVLTSSLSGKYGVPKLAAYAASKHAMQGYFDSLRAETYGSGLFIHIVIPGFIRTNITVVGLRGDGSQSGKMQNALAEGMDPATCAKGILKGLEKGKDEFVVGGSERFTIGFNRFFPGLMKKLIRSNPLQRIKKLRKSIFRK